jgi:hypothetical protein
MTWGRSLDKEVSAHECLVCLAERFGIKAAGQWIADVLAGLVRAASDRVVLAQVPAEIAPFARDVIEHRAPPPTGR